MAAYEVMVDAYQLLTYDLQTAIDEFTAALADHTFTVDVPAPTSTTLVETIVRYHDGLFVIVMPPPKADPQPLPKDPKYYRSAAEQIAIAADVAKKASPEEK